MWITSPGGTFNFKFLVGTLTVLGQAMFTFGRRVLFAFALSILILGAILVWTLEHTDIVAFVTILLIAIGFEATVLFSLIKNAAIPENSVANQRVGTGITSIWRK